MLFAGRTFSADALSLTKPNITVRRWHCLALIFFMNEWSLSNLEELWHSKKRLEFIYSVWMFSLIDVCWIILNWNWSGQPRHCVVSILVTISFIITSAIIWLSFIWSAYHILHIIISYGCHNFIMSYEHIWSSYNIHHTINITWSSNVMPSYDHVIWSSHQLLWFTGPDTPCFLVRAIWPATL